MFALSRDFRYYTIVKLDRRCCLKTALVQNLSKITSLSFFSIMLFKWSAARKWIENAITCNVDLTHFAIPLANQLKTIVNLPWKIRYLEGYARCDPKTFFYIRHPLTFTWLHDHHWGCFTLVTHICYGCPWSASAASRLWLDNSQFPLAPHITLPKESLILLSFPYIFFRKLCLTKHIFTLASCRLQPNCLQHDTRGMKSFFSLILFLA